MTAYPVIPGVPPAGHITSRGYWHPGHADNCDKCAPRCPHAPSRTCKWGDACADCDRYPPNRSTP